MIVLAHGAPFDQGRRQGVALRSEVVTAVHAVRSRCDSWGWYGARLRKRRGAARALAGFLPQVHERLRGIARGAKVSLRALEILETLPCPAGMVDVKDGEVAASFELAPEVERVLCLRQSVPDAGGLSSVELTAAPWVGCLAGVNAAGVGLVCLEDRAECEPSLRLLAQDVLLRARALDSGIEHLQRRASYLGGSGVLLLVDAGGRAVRAVLRAGQMDIQPLQTRGTQGPEASVRVNALGRTLVWRDAAGAEHRAGPAPPAADHPS